MCAMLDTALDDSHCSSESSELALQMDLWPVKQQQRDYVRICVQEEVRLRRLLLQQHLESAQEDRAIGVSQSIRSKSSCQPHTHREV